MSGPPRGRLVWITLAVGLGCATTASRATRAPAGGPYAGFDQEMTRHMGAMGIPGGAVAAAKNGRPVYSQGYGLADRDRREPVRPDSLFRIASVSKPITAVAVLQLVERGRLRLDDLVLPLLRMPKDPGVRPDSRLGRITIRHLLNHSGGWDRDHGFDPMFRPGEIAREIGVPPPAGPEAILRYMFRRPLEFDPGSKWKYGASIDVLGYIVQKVSGQPLEVFLKERIFEPLGMTDTAFFVPAEKMARFSANYYSDGKGRMIIRDDPSASGYLRKPGLASGGGGLVGTASDYMRFLLMIANGGEWQGRRILSARKLPPRLTLR